MTAALLAAGLTALVLWLLSLPQVRLGLGVAAAAAAALAVAEGYGVIVLALAVLAAAGVLGPVAFLHRFVVPGRFCFHLAGAS